MREGNRGEAFLTPREGSVHINESQQIMRCAVNHVQGGGVTYIGSQKAMARWTGIANPKARLCRMTWASMPMHTRARGVLTGTSTGQHMM